MSEALHIVAALLEDDQPEFPLDDPRLNLDPDAIDAKSYLTRVEPPKLIKTTFSRTTPESAEQGDFSETGWIDEEGEDMTLEPWEEREGITVVDKAVKFLRREGVSETSSVPWHPGGWYSSGWSDPDMHTMEQEERSYHLEGFTREEETLIFLKLFPQKAKKYGLSH